MSQETGEMFGHRESAFRFHATLNAIYTFMDKQNSTTVAPDSSS